MNPHPRVHPSWRFDQAFQVAARSGLTLVEVLVVVAIIGGLVALLLPTVQSARESARLTQCKNHVKQITIACQQHDATMRFWPGYAGEAMPARLEFPSARSRNTALLGPNWIVECLRRGDQQTLAEGLIAACLPTPAAVTESVAAVVRQPVAYLACPSRRPAQAYPLHTPFKERFGDFGAKTDYAMNGGAGEPNPANTDNGIVKEDGIWIVGVRTLTARIGDGLSNTYLAGEKSIDSAAIDDGGCFGDRSPIVGYPDDSGASNSMVRFAIRQPERDRAGNCRVCHDFGSSHAAGWNVSMCDGSVRTQGFDTDIGVHRALASSRGKD